MDHVHGKSSQKPLTPFQKLQIELSHVIEGTPAGEKLPSEPKLAKQLGVSRATLREAMRSFEGNGLIRRKQGVGTYVIGPTPVIETGLEVLESIETLSAKMGLNVTMGDLKYEYIKADEILSGHFGIALDADLVSISRVILTDNRPIAYLIDILPKSQVSEGDLQTGFTGSVLDRLIASNNYVLSKSKTLINAVGATSSIAKALEIQRGDVLLMFEAFLFDDDDSVIDYSLSYFLPGHFRFQVMRRIG